MSIRHLGTTLEIGDCILDLAIKISKRTPSQTLPSATKLVATIFMMESVWLLLEVVWTRQDSNWSLMARLGLVSFYLPENDISCQGIFRPLNQNITATVLSQNPTQI